MIDSLPPYLKLMQISPAPFRRKSVREKSLLGGIGILNYLNYFKNN